MKDLYFRTGAASSATSMPRLRGLNAAEGKQADFEYLVTMNGQAGPDGFLEFPHGNSPLPCAASRPLPLGSSRPSEGRAGRRGHLGPGGGGRRWARRGWPDRAHPAGTSQSAEEVTTYTSGCVTCPRRCGRGIRLAR